jgi:hypothetical protein
MMQFTKFSSAVFFVFFLILQLSAQAQLITYPGNFWSHNVKDYGAKGDGVTDDTKAIQAALNANRKGVDTGGKLDYFHSWPKTLFFPKGTYLVSDSLVWIGQSMMIIGQGRGQTIIQLKNNASPFRNASKPKAVIKTPDGIHQFRNYIRDLTINVGSGNPGVIAVDFVANNSGGLVNVEIKSNDRQGKVGISMTRYAPGPCMLSQVSISGFDYGIKTDKLEYSITLENIVLTGQKVAGIENNGNILMIRKLNSTNSVPVIRNVGGPGMVTLLNSTLRGGSSSRSAIENNAGFLFARSIATSGYRSAILNKGSVVSGTSVSEFNSGSVSSLFTSPGKSLNLAIEETPEYHNNDMSKWAQLSSPGWYGDNRTWQSTINSGKPVIYWQAGRYLAYNRTYTVPLTVRKMMGFGAVINTGDQFGVKLQIKEGNENSPPLIIEHVGYGVTIEHLCKRLVVIKHCKLNDYISSTASGKLFLEDVELHKFVTIYPQQKVYARQWNNEADKRRIWNKGGMLWIMGMKTERKGYVIKTTNCGRTELLGGLLYPTKPFSSSDSAAFICENSKQSLIFGTSSYISGGMYPTLVREKRSSTTRELKNTGLQGRFISLHVGYDPSTCLNGARIDFEEEKEAEEPEESSMFELFPNPVKDQLNIRNTSSHDCEVKAYVIDFQGRVIHQIDRLTFSAGETKTLHQIQGLRAGGYLLRLEGEQTQFTTKFIFNP